MEIVKRNARINEISKHYTFSLLIGFLVFLILGSKVAHFRKVGQKPNTFHSFLISELVIKSNVLANCCIRLFLWSVGTSHVSNTCKVNFSQLKQEKNITPQKGINSTLDRVAQKNNLPHCNVVQGVLTPF